jgi:hypothetical protein
MIRMCEKCHQRKVANATKISGKCHKNKWHITKAVHIYWDKPKRNRPGVCRMEGK